MSLFGQNWVEDSGDVNTEFSLLSHWRENEVTNNNIERRNLIYVNDYNEDELKELLKIINGKLESIKK